MTALTRLILSTSFLLMVGLLEPHEGALAFRTLGEIATGLNSLLGASVGAPMQLAQIGDAWASQRPSHEVLDFAVSALGYPVNASLHLGLTLTGMLLVGAGVLVRCRQD